MPITEADILYEDNHLIAINKRSGDIVQVDETGDEPLDEMVSEYYKLKNIGIERKIHNPDFNYCKLLLC